MKRKNIIVGCEYSGIVRDAFIRRGHNAISCDLEDTESPGPHLKCDIVGLLKAGVYYDLGIFHPDCTKMAVCGNRTWAGTVEREAAVLWTMNLWELAKKYCKSVCFEQPQTVLFKRMGVKAQYIQPWQFGHPEKKKTGLALHNLPKLFGTANVYDYMMTLPKKKRERVFYMAPGQNRGKDRSKFYTGFATAMAEQWG